MSRFESNCPECGRAFINSHVEMRTFCSVGCQADSIRAQADSIRAQAEAARGDGQLSKERSPLAPGEGTWSVFAELADARAELEGLRSLIAEAHRELSNIEAITVSPSDTDGLLDLVRRLKEAMPRSAEQNEARLRALGFEPVNEKQRAENLLVNLGVAK